MADNRVLVERYVRLAFQKVGTLAKDILFSSKQSNGFNFSTGVATVTLANPVSVKAIQLKAKKPKREEGIALSTKSIELLMISKDAPNMDSYDIVTVDGVAWNIVRPIVDDGYLITVEATREI